ncbi:MAG: hypothetical protein U5L95_03240 [Candidatus Saccharibacteria bacterium]|nr:hypothetical protein [Candidatus Saccharibacteria bacterium]
MSKNRELTPENYSEFSQRSLLQGIVVEANNEQAQYIVTHVLDGKEEVLDYDFDFYPEFRTASVHSPWYSETPESYRALLYELNGDESPDAFPASDSVALTDNLELLPGDTIHVHQTMFWETDEQGRKSGYPRYDVCKLPVANTGLSVVLETIRAERLERIAQKIKKIEEDEQEAMSGCVRILPNEPTRPFENPGPHNTDSNRYQRISSRYAYGDGVVDDHFVDIKAQEAYIGDVELGGVRRFGADGTEYLVPSIMPFGEGTIEDPLYELEIHIHSETKLNPAVGELRGYVMIDGTKYEALLDPEVSSHYFENPGHDITFSGFRAEGVQFDMVGINKEQSDALYVRSRREQDIAMDQLYASIDRREDFADKLEQIDQRAQQAAREQRQLQQKEQKIIDSIRNNPRKYTISTGASILVPRSMLDAIEVVLGSNRE